MWPILDNCHLWPDVSLEDFNIRDMELLHNTKTTNNASQWLVNSDINVTLSMTNQNSGEMFHHVSALSFVPSHTKAK